MPESDYSAMLKPLVRKGKALLIVPPFASLDQPALGVHVLQTCARETGFRVGILYANFLLAAAIGIENYLAFNVGRRVPRLAGECLFARSAYGLPLLDSWVNRSDFEILLEDAPVEQVNALNDLDAETFPLTLPHLRQLEEIACAWLDGLAEAVAEIGFPIVGVTTSYEQTNVAVALLKRIKCHNTKTITIVGGANCAGEMAQGIASLDPDAKCIDHIFSGESETTFVDFLRGASAGKLPSTRIIRGMPCQNMDALPTPDFHEYVEQLDCFLPNAGTVVRTAYLCYENSRGCWWGEKHQCSFCGGNGENITFRQKSPKRVLEDIDRLVKTYPIRRVLLADEIMPREYFQTLLPRLADQVNGLDITGSVKANLSLDDLLTLKRAGFSSIGSGVESLSSGLLALMNKGLKAHQVIALLRYARVAGVHLRWNFLWGFPGDTLDMYQEIRTLIPLIRHLQPPQNILHLVVTRFSPYFDNPAAYGVYNVRPLASYAAAFPPHADSAKLAVNFAADYECAAHRNLDLMADLIEEISAWQQCWEAEMRAPLTLRVIEFDGSYVLVDTRGLPGTQKMALLTPTQATVALVSQPYAETEEIAWALENKVGVALDGWYVPLATAAPDLLQAFENGAVCQDISSVTVAQSSVASQ